MFNEAFRDDPAIWADWRQTRVFPEIFLEDSPLAPLNNFPFSRATLAELDHALALLTDVTIKMDQEVNKDNAIDRLLLFSIVQLYGIVLTEIKETRIFVMCPDGQDLLDFKPDLRLSAAVPPHGGSHGMH